MRDFRPLTSIAMHARLSYPCALGWAPYRRVSPSRTMAFMNDLRIVVARVLIATVFFLAGIGKENRKRR
jgi:hypothetical protein